MCSLLSISQFLQSAQMELYHITITLSEGGMSMQIRVAHPYSKCELRMRVCGQATQEGNENGSL